MSGKEEIPLVKIKKNTNYQSINTSIKTLDSYNNLSNQSQFYGYGRAVLAWSGKIKKGR